MAQQDLLRNLANNYAHAVYGLCRKLPEDEKFGITSQAPRSALSVPLNIIEGYSRQSLKSEVQFLLISYGSLKQTQYIINFAVAESYLSSQETVDTLQLGEQLARLLWTKVQRFKTQSKVAS